MTRASDTTLLTRAYHENRIVLTEDKDFGELVYRLRQPAHGIILLRFDPRNGHLKDRRVLQFLQDYSDRLIGSFVIVEIDKVRLRPLPS